VTDRLAEPESSHGIKKITVFCVEKFKEVAVEDTFRQHLLTITSTKSINIDESKRPAFKPVNESFRKLAVD